MNTNRQFSVYIVIIIANKSKLYLNFNNILILLYKIPARTVTVRAGAYGADKGICKEQTRVCDGIAIVAAWRSIASIFQ